MEPEINLDDVSVEELLQELRAREEPTRSRAGPAVGDTPERLGDVDSERLVAALQDNQRVIYGSDDRQDLFQVTDPDLRRDADCVVALLDQGQLVDNGDGTSQLLVQNFGTSRNLCPSERFRDQPTAAFCSGFLVAPDIVATAGHCVDATTVGNTRFVFGFQMVNASTARQQIANAEIYRGAALIDRREQGAGADWALVRLDRAVTNHQPARVRSTGRIPNGQAVHVIGHPSGLPLKVAAGANVRDNSPNAFFVANLDTYGGNSGSPVFNSQSHTVEGILVRGETDFVMQGTCRVSLVCPTTGCRGEDCTRVTELRFPLSAIEGRLTFLRVHDVGTGYGPPFDFIDVEVVCQVDSRPGQGFGFQLRDDASAMDRKGMLDVLRTAFSSGSRIRIDYTAAGMGNGRIIRVANIA